MKPYYADAQVQLFVGDCRKLVPALGLTPDLVVADPPYGETSLPWDRWPTGWLAALGDARSLWCFGSLRMFLAHRDEFAQVGWKLSHDVVWQKPAGSSMVADRFKRVHEHVLHWYIGDWAAVHHDAQRERHYGPNRGVRARGADRGEHFGSIRARAYEDDGTRLLESVQRVAHMHKRGIHHTEKPVGLLDPLIAYGCPPGGLVLDPFAGSASTLVAARASGRRAVGVEADEAMAEKAARRLAQSELFGGAA